LYDFETDPHFECVGHLTTRERDVVVRVEGWQPEADGRTLLWFNRHQYFSRTYKSHLVAEVTPDGSERVIYHDMLADNVEAEPGKTYHVWIMAAAATPGPDGKLAVEPARAGQGHVKLYRRVHADDVDLPPKKENKKSFWARLFGRR
jgi:hypothetical protein